MRELKHLGDADRGKVSAVERVAHAFPMALTPWNGSDGPLAEGADS
nr:MAG TPA: hypothetical protein [Caudoviricetes sp.]